MNINKLYIIGLIILVISSFIALKIITHKIATVLYMELDGENEKY